jgi:hypothetical protein
MKAMEECNWGGLAPTEYGFQAIAPTVFHERIKNRRTKAPAVYFFRIEFNLIPAMRRLRLP